MKLLLDTQPLLWVATDSVKLSKAAKALILAQENELFFSAVSLWEIAIKKGLGRDDFRVKARVLRRALLDNGYGEILIASDHTVAVEDLPPIHKDAFDRILGPWPKLTAIYAAPPSCFCRRRRSPACRRWAA
jgi:PIN domain nuclease of toxin-antitoxin system